MTAMWTIIEMNQRLLPFIPVALKTAIMDFMIGNLLGLGLAVSLNDALKIVGNGRSQPMDCCGALRRKDLQR
jgi:hypothetical protein